MPQSVCDARNNAKINGIQNVEFLEDACNQKFLNAVAKMNPERIIYVSCNPATLARDLRLLSELGYQTDIVRPVDMFPYTYHVETVVLMQCSGLKDEK